MYYPAWQAQKEEGEGGREKGKEFLKNSEGLSGPKPQTDMLNIFVRLRKEPFALLGDASQMCRQPPSSFIHHTDFQGLKSE